MTGKCFTRYLKTRGRERGVVLIAVLMFIAVLLPVTLLILDSVRIESLLPVNEAYVRTAGDEADKGFDQALAAIVANQDPFVDDVSRNYSDPAQNPDYYRNLSPKSQVGKHGISYLAQSWARHPDNDTVFLQERSLENIANVENPDAGGNPDIHSVPVRWQLMNVPFGMDDFGEYYNDNGDHPRFLLPFEYVRGQVGLSVDQSRAPAFYVDPSDLSMMAGQTEGDPVSYFSATNLRSPDMYWELPPSDPSFYWDLGRLASIIQFRPRPASYFRNTKGDPSGGIGNAVLPATENDITSTAGFVRENNNSIDRLVYQGNYDFSLGANQYPNNITVQQAVADSTWANPFFGSTGASTNLAAAFTTNNKEYKPAPGTLTKYQLGAQEGDTVPGWHETIVSDESGRFPINQLLNVIFSSDNLDYNTPDRPLLRRDQFDSLSFDDLINNADHPNHGGFLMAREMLISLLMSDADMARLADNWDQNLYNTYKRKATWMIRQMLERRRQLDEACDFDRNGDLYNDESHGEIYQVANRSANNDSGTLDNAPGLSNTDGTGRMGDGQDLFDGTWQVYSNPKEMLSWFKVEAVPPAWTLPITSQDFETLNQRVTVYSMDTEHMADPDHPHVGAPGVGRELRFNINRMAPKDDPNTVDDESALYTYLLPIIGKARLDSIIAWRDGRVDVNGDGDLNDEYIEQPVSNVRYDPATTSYQAVGEYPVTTFTYRERNNANFQDPTLPAALIDPDLLNIKSLGDLLNVPMVSSEGLLLFSQATNGTNDPNLVLQNNSGAQTILADRSLYGKFSNNGNAVAYDDSSDTYKNDLALLVANQQLVQNNRKHPSWGANDALMSYYNGQNLYKHDMVTNADSAVLNNADLPPDITDTAANPFWLKWNLDELIGNAIFEMASPDLSPNGANNEICFTQVEPTSAGGSPFKFLDPKVAYNLAIVKTDGTGFTLITQNNTKDTNGNLGTFDYAPDFSSDGQLIVFTRTTNQIFNFLHGILDSDIPSTTIWLTDRSGSFQIPLLMPWDIDATGAPPDSHLVEIDPSNPAAVKVTLHQPMFPSFAPDDQSVVFMDVPLTFTFDATTGVTPFVVQKAASPTVANIWRIKLDFFQAWSDKQPIAGADDATEFETFPDAGQGNMHLAAQGDSQIGDVPGTAISLLNAATATNEPFTVADKQAIAMDIGEASTALRRTIGWGADDQNWKLKDLPSVPEQTVDVLKQIADVVCFRDPTVTYDPRYQMPNPIPFPPPVIPAAPIQAYPGRININTADRSVLRTIFLNMFQGPENDSDDDGNPDGPEPRVRDGAGSRYINIMDPALDNNAGDPIRFKALMIADRYAQQVVEYRKWIYNNQGDLGVTDETVPSNLPLYELAFAGGSHYGNFRANPFYPMVDTNGDGIAPEVPRYNPEPPFRSVADLFNVMLYDNDAFTSDWTYEGIDGNGGPDKTYLPRAFDPNDPTSGPTGSADELTVWGPIFNTDKQRTVTHPGGPLGNGWLTGFATTVDNNFTDAANYNLFYEQQSFRLFSADDFRRIAPFLTVRTYDYRIESRGVVRISSGSQRTDITRDKIWIITTNTDADLAHRTRASWDVTDPYAATFTSEFEWDASAVAQNQGDRGYYTMFFEETPQSGLSLTRSTFLPE